MSLENQQFGSFGLAPKLLEILVKMGFSVPTSIQLQAIPVIMAGSDLLAIAPTGTGKTAAFGLPAISNLTTQKEKQLLVLAPTRELATQTFKFLKEIGSAVNMQGALLVGGAPFSRQFADWNRGVDFIVATPGRLIDHATRGLELKNIGILVLDEVDRMLDMGFAPQIEEIAKKVSKERQTLFFSATLPKEIQKLAHSYLKDPVRVTVGGKKEDAPKIREERIVARGYEKLEITHKTILSTTGKVLVFSQTQMFTDRIAEQLESLGIEAARLHGGRTQSERNRALDAFRRGRVRVLIATDIASRGIDVADIEVVINFDRASTKEAHTHRIGRTGRCGKEGLAITFVDDRSYGERPRHQERRSFHERPSYGRGAPRERSDRFEKNSDRKPFGKPAAKRFDSGPPQREQRSERGFKHRGISEGVSGTVRYFRNEDSKPLKVKKRHIIEPRVFKPAKPHPGLARGKKGAVRRPGPTQSAV